MGKGKKALLAFVFLPLTNGMERQVQIFRVFICFLVYLMEFQLVKAKRRNLIPFELILVVKHGNYLYLLRHREKRSSDASSVFTFISRFDHSSMTRNSGKNTERTSKKPQNAQAVEHFLAEIQKDKGQLVDPFFAIQCTLH